MKSSVMNLTLCALALTAMARPLWAIPLPDASSIASPSIAFSITNTGTGGAAQFKVDNPANAVQALYAATNGKGRAGYFLINNSTNTLQAIFAATAGAGQAGLFQISNAANTSQAIYALTNGKGKAALFQVTNPANSSDGMQSSTNGTGTAIHALTTGIGRSGFYELNNVNSNSFGLEVNSNGQNYSLYSLNTGIKGPNTPQSGGAGWFEIDRKDNEANALVGQTNGIGYAVHGLNTGFLQGNDISYSGGAGLFETDSVGNHAATVLVRSNGQGDGVNINLNNKDGGGTGLVINHAGFGQGMYVSTLSAFSPVAQFANFNPSSTTQTIYAYTQSKGDAIKGFTLGNGNAVSGENKGTGYAGYFTGTGSNSNGVYASAPVGHFGLNVVSGTKNAIVGTSTGARALYTEESSEVWFTDYGFGQLKDGKAEIELEPTFAETVSLDEPYHVFVQTYGDADLMVLNRTSSGFTVKARGDRGERNVEFSYRLVAKRKGYEKTRLERAPLADKDPNLFPKISSEPAKP